MNEAIDELKENEFKELYSDENKAIEKTYVKDLQLDTDFELLFPDEFINNITERLKLYNELSLIKMKLRCKPMKISSWIASVHYQNRRFHY